MSPRRRRSGSSLRREWRRGITDEGDLARLSPRERAERNGALHALAALRRGESLEVATQRYDLNPEEVRFWVGDALDANSDRLVREMFAIGRDGPTEVVVYGSRPAGIVADHANAVRQFLETGDRSALAAFRGTRVGGVWLEVRSEVLVRLAREGALDVEYLYVEVFE